MLDAEEDAVEVDGLLTLPISECHGDDAAADADAGVVHEDVHTTHCRERGCYDLFPFGFAGDVVMHELGMASLVADRGGGRFASFVLNVGDHDGGALVSQANRTASTDSGCAARDYRDLANDPS